MRLAIFARSTGVVAALMALGLVSCRSSTQVTLQVRTNVPCAAGSDWQGVAVYVGKPGLDLERASATLVTRTCDERGNVGTLVVVPSAEKDGELGLRVVAGLTKNPEDCAEGGYEGCIVARRALRFNPHDDLEIDVELTRDCISVGCDPEHSCLSGRCVESRVLDAVRPELPAIVGPSVRCGDDGVRCATSGDVCCLSVNAELGTSTGQCQPSEACQLPSIVLHCDDDSDCAGNEDGTGTAALCALSYHKWFSPEGMEYHHVPAEVSHSACRHAHTSSIGSSVGLGLCQDRTSCADGEFPCEASQGNFLESPGYNLLPGYFWCRVFVP